jgi:hypothetical protein
MDGARHVVVQEERIPDATMIRHDDERRLQSGDLLPAVGLEPVEAAEEGPERESEEDVEIP